ncbi:MAG: hypothetical protein KOO69_06680 [Victivallales bacterium]|nr:hypothetical protein [Victivallales bacterium]
MIYKILAYMLNVWEDFVDYMMMGFYAHVIPDWRFILWVFLIGTFLLGSAFLTATIAESRRHKMKFHFMLGLIAPYIYPLVLAFRLKVAQEAMDIEDEIDPLNSLSNSMSARLKNIQDEQQSKRDKKIQRLAPKEEAAEEEQREEIVEETVVENEEVVEEASVFNQRYFQELAVDSSGAKSGPFNLVVLNGTRFKIAQIKNIQVDMASFEVEVKGKLKNIRIKYDNIESFEKI